MLVTWKLPYPTVFLTDAWHVANNSDPLLDSDDEFADHHTQLDYCKTLHYGIISVTKLTPLSASAKCHYEAA